jgi:hypothetical protein
MHFFLPNIINAMYIQQLTEVILPPIQKNVGVWKQIAVLIFVKLVLG